MPFKQTYRTIDDFSADTVERFTKYVDDSAGPWACWPWLKTHTNSGYGFINYKCERTGKDKTITAHRLAALLSGKDINGKVVIHKCDRKSCANPNHLIVGTQKDNMQDSVRKGRFHRPELRGKKGSLNKNAKLNETDVKTIRELKQQGMRTDDIAKKFKIHSVTVSNIIRRKTWQHVE